jgi:hypothetical protein
MIHGFGMFLGHFMTFHVLIRLYQMSVVFMINYHNRFKNIFID